MAVIKRPYLLVSNIPCFVNSSGQRFVDALWQKDIVEHLRYIEHFTLAAPLSDEMPPSNAACLESIGTSPVSYVDLPNPRSFRAALFGVLRVAFRLWKAIGRAEIVHFGVAGWPIPLGWIAAPLARLRGRFLVVVVESAPWRTPLGGDRQASLRRLFAAALFERMARWCVRLAHAPFFTQSSYRDSLLKRFPERGHVIPASWVDARTVLDDAHAETLWAVRLHRADEPLTILFAGRLVSAKGIDVLLKAMHILDKQELPVRLEILGSGDLLEECSRCAASLRGKATIHLLGTVAYGDSFFQLLRRFHMLVVPSVSDEQPRIVYDAFSQSLPVLASDTPGLRQCVDDDVNGSLVPPGDAEALAAKIRWASNHRGELKRLGMAGLQAVRALTHEEMHRRREQILSEALPKWYLTNRSRELSSGVLLAPCGDTVPRS
jgi:glycosyltransferase involved in cell wall biosynthesis